MDAIRQAATGISVAAVAIGSVYIICPDGVLNRKMKYIIGLIMLLCITTPFLSADFKINYTEISSSLSQDATSMLESQAKYIIESTLRSENIRFERIEIFTDISESGDISINSVHIYGAQEKEKIKELINSAFTVREVIFND